MVAITPTTFSQSETQYPTLSDTAAADSPQKDGVPNLLKYLYDIDPARPMTAADRTGLLVFDIASGGNLTLTYRQNSLLDQLSVTFNVQTSVDLKNWTTLALGQTLTTTTYTIRQVNNDPNTGDPSMQVQVEPTGASRQFVRLNLIEP